LWRRNKSHCWLLCRDSKAGGMCSALCRVRALHSRGGLPTFCDLTPNPSSSAFACRSGELRRTQSALACREGEIRPLKFILFYISCANLHFWTHMQI
jgi:hypothetical protein